MSKFGLYTKFITHESERDSLADILLEGERQTQHTFLKVDRRVFVLPMRGRLASGCHLRLG